MIDLAREHELAHVAIFRKGYAKSYGIVDDWVKARTGSDGIKHTMNGTVEDCTTELAKMYETEKAAVDKNYSDALTSVVDPENTALQNTWGQGKTYKVESNYAVEYNSRSGKWYRAKVAYLPIAD